MTASLEPPGDPAPETPSGQTQEPSSGDASAGLPRELSEPMDLGQMVDAVIRLYRRHPGLLLGLCAVLQVPAAIVAGIILLPLPERFAAVLGFDPFDPTLTRLPTDLPSPTTAQLIDLFTPLWLATLVTAVAAALTTVAVAWAVLRLRSDRSVGLGSAYRVVLGRTLATLGAMVTSTLVLLGLVVIGVAAFALILGLAPDSTGGGPVAFVGLLALVALLVLTVFVAIRWTFWPQAVVIEQAGPVASLGRSWRVVAGATWRVVGYVLLFGFAANILAGLLAQLGLIAVDAVAGAVGATAERLLSFTVNTVTTLLLAPIVPVAMTLLYLDIRLRRGDRPTA